MTFTKAARGREKAVDWSPRLWDESRLKVFETARGNNDNMYVTPWGGNTGHVFNQRQRNAFIKPITGKSCGTEPHSHFHYSLSGDSYLHLTWCLFSILFESILAISIPCFIVTVVENKNILPIYFQVKSSPFYHTDTLKVKDLCDLFFLTFTWLLLWLKKFCNPGAYYNPPKYGIK